MHIYIEPTAGKRHRKSASIPSAPPPWVLSAKQNAAAASVNMSRTIGDINDTQATNRTGYVRKKNVIKNGGNNKKLSTKSNPPQPPHVNLKRKDLVRNSQKNAQKNSVTPSATIATNDNDGSKVSGGKVSGRTSPKKKNSLTAGSISLNGTKRKRVRVHKKSSRNISAIPQEKIIKKKESSVFGGNEDNVTLKFENRYERMSMITPDQLEILARKLLNVKSLNEDDDDEKRTDKHGRRNSFNYKHPKTRIKRGQHNHLLQSNVSRKSESVSFGLQLINSIKQITANLTDLMETFSEGLNDLLRICQQFIELIIDPLPRQVYNDYNDKIDEYISLVQTIDDMSNNFYDSSQNLRDNIPSLASILQSDISDRINEYNQYVHDFKSADNDIKSLQIHCDRTIRRLFREIPKPMMSSTSNGEHVDNNDEPNNVRQKSLKQHKGIRVFGQHYVAANSNEHICRAVPSKIRKGVMSNYIHYLTLLDTMNYNTRNCYNVVLPKVNVEFEESQFKLKKHVTQSMQNIDTNLSYFFDKKQVMAKKKHLGGGHRNRYHRYNKNKPDMEYTRKPTMYRKPLAPIKPYELHSNSLMASPMHVYSVIEKIDDYVNEEHEKKTYDEYESLKIQKKRAKAEQKETHGIFSLKAFSKSFDSENYINSEIIQNFFNNHYYHLGDILFEIPDLYEAFENYLKLKLSSENLYFLREIDDIYFKLDQLNGANSCDFNHNVAVQESKNIYKKFISDDSNEQINLPGNVFKQINKDLKRINKFTDPISIFDKAYDCISSLIHKESLPSFYKSQHFKNWYEKQRAQQEKKLKKKEKKTKKMIDK